MGSMNVAPWAFCVLEGGGGREGYRKDAKGAKSGGRGRSEYITPRRRERRGRGGEAKDHVDGNCWSVE